MYDAERYVSGVALFSFDVASGAKYQHLLTLFAVGGFCLFAALLCIGRLSRDSFLSFSVLGLVLIALVFIVYPLYAAVPPQGVLKGFSQLMFASSVPPGSPMLLSSVTVTVARGARV